MKKNKKTYKNKFFVGIIILITILVITIIFLVQNKKYKTGTVNIGNSSSNLVQNKKYEADTVYVGNLSNKWYLKYNEEIYEENSIENYGIANINSESVKWLKIIKVESAEIFDFKVFPDNKKILITVHPLINYSRQRGYLWQDEYKILVFDTTNEKTEELLNFTADGNEYNIPKINSISNDEKYISLRMTPCYGCGGYSSETLLYSIYTKKIKKIKQTVLDFKWLDDGLYQYRVYKSKMCPGEFDGPAGCFENTPLKTERF